MGIVEKKKEFFFFLSLIRSGTFRHNILRVSIVHGTFSVHKIPVSTLWRMTCFNRVGPLRFSPFSCKLCRTVRHTKNELYHYVYNTVLYFNLPRWIIHLTFADSRPAVFNLFLIYKTNSWFYIRFIDFSIQRRTASVSRAHCTEGKFRNRRTDKLSWTFLLGLYPRDCITQKRYVRSNNGLCFAPRT